MLVLSRRAGEGIVISGRITITVNRIAGNRVTLAFDAPRQVKIRRSELPVLDDGTDVELDLPRMASSLAIDKPHMAPE